MKVAKELLKKVELAITSGALQTCAVGVAFYCDSTCTSTCAAGCRGTCEDDGCGNGCHSLCSHTNN